MVERLARGPASVSELAAPFAMTLSAVGQHVRMLQETGLVRTRKVGRVRRVELAADALSVAEDWFRRHRTLWETRLDRLGALLSEDDDEHPAKKDES